MHSIHPTAIVSKESQLGDGVVIGPYCILSGKVVLGAGVKLLSHVCITGPVTIGKDTELSPFSCIGMPPQDFKYKPGDATAGVVIGERCMIREYATVHAATKPDIPTRVGNQVLMMCSSHVGHDATTEDRVVLVNNAALAGHSHVGEGATLSAYVGVHQFGRVGKMAFVSANVPVTRDVLPFCIAAHRKYMAGLNLVGLRRSGMPAAQITVLRETFRDTFRQHRTREDLVRILSERAAACPPVAEWVRFVQGGKRTVMMAFDPMRAGETADAADIQ